MFSQNYSPLPPPVPRAPHKVFSFLLFFSFILRATNFMKKFSILLESQCMQEKKMALILRQIRTQQN